jgi:hypothetical protein
MTGLVLNLFAILLSLTAIIISARIAARQARYLRQANHVPFAAQMLRDLRDPQFIRDEDYVVSVLAQECKPELGTNDLPLEAKIRVLNVASYYQTIGALAAYDILEREMIAYLIGRRVVRAWSALEPYFKVERLREGNGASVFSMFEDLAMHAEDVDRPAIAKRLGLRQKARGAGLVGDAPAPERVQTQQLPQPE